MSSVGVSGGRRTGAVILAVILVIIAVLAAIAGIIYLTKTADSLPAFMPGRRAGNTGHDTVRAVASFLVAVIALIGAWFAMRRGASSGTAQG